MAEKIQLQLFRERNINVVDAYLTEDENGETVTIELCYDNVLYQSEDVSFFEALVQIREKLEQNGILVACNGALKNVYPSPMMLRMGTGRTAYVLHLGHHAKMSDVVDIFDSNILGEWCSVNKQQAYYQEWLSSL